MNCASEAIDPRLSALRKLAVLLVFMMLAVICSRVEAQTLSKEYVYINGKLTVIETRTTYPSPECVFFTANGGPSVVPVLAEAGHAWKASSEVSWITITSGTSGSGNGSVKFAVAANAGEARTGTLNVQGRTYTLTQAARLAPPAHLIAASSDRQITLSWDAAAGAAVYEIERQSDGGTEIFSLDKTVRAWTDDTASAGVPYAYRMRAVDTYGVPSEYSDWDAAIAGGTGSSDRALLLAIIFERKSARGDK